ncbi:non-canonical purine NTP pyrophosphatase [Piscinibacter koreensis]|uniref:dITP/XTP pyrophosphatase n=1 Tax=Piscinibacter koreensis TaxID=2742824 RepID=A0A7Y6TXK8_9BURK|nr:non-canonical purine NTP pyrophosphatase [Schlegelella koreensis]NUZ07278.1 non-canonical purine NTP pyrophosphatase [Schlegelella koreensis]
MGTTPASTPRRVVVASNNAKKLAELQQLLAPAGVELVAQGTLGIAEAEEPHLTFIENALAKARHAARAAGLPALADDSGLCVDALGGEPGVQSAVYAGSVEAPAGAEREARRRLQDAANNRLLLERLSGTADRRARFVSTLVAVRHADDPEPLVAIGRWDARILDAPRGSGGFGYDPLVFVDALGTSVAELDAGTKNRHSHRARAAAAMRELIAEAWRIGPPTA